ncbi:hypothetical protein TNCV_2905211 [Trichonephila clavipes]|nr:hypothetical protein TNCV_2905211 [Trichonephila clavipes]
MYIGGGTLNSRRAANPIVRYAEDEERWETPDHLQSIGWKWNKDEQIRTVTGMVLKAKPNDRRKNLAQSRDELRGP